MIVRKTIKCKVLELRKRKEELLNREFNNFQRFLHGDKSVVLYSATKQQAERLLKRIKKPKEGKQYPLILRNDVYRTDTKITPYWLKIPIGCIRGGIHVPIMPHEPMTPDVRAREAKVIKRKGSWYIYITIEKEVKERETNGVIAVDLGIRNSAVTVSTSSNKPKFYGKKIRAIRGHYFYLRREVGKKRRTLKKIGNHEKRIINNELHNISKTIIKEANETNSAIVLGNLKEIRKQNKGRKFNRKLNSWTYYRLSQFITYKANWLGIPVIKISERGTSKTCSRCNEIGHRVGGYFKCSACGLELNADVNGARNILKRAVDYMSNSRVAMTQPQTHGTDVALNGLHANHISTLGNSTL